MSKITGKSYSILKRLHHFYHPSDVNTNISDFIEIFARRLQLTEKDLYEILHSHHVHTADKEGKSGYTAKPEERGDLDKIFAMYLEFLGGTSKLVEVNSDFTKSSIYPRAMVNTLIKTDSVLINYLKERFAATDLYQDWYIVSCFHADNACLKPKDITPGFVLELIICSLPLTKYIKTKLTQKTIDILSEYNGKEVTQGIKEAVCSDFNSIILKDKALFTQNYQSVFKAKIPTDFKDNVLHSVFKDFFYQQYEKIEDQDKRDLQLESLAKARTAPKPLGADLIRTNRLLLERVYGKDTVEWGFETADIPTIDLVEKTLAKMFNSLLTIEDLYTPERFSSIQEDYEIIKKRFAKDIKGFNRAILESQFSLEMEKSFAPYRDRLLELINVLRKGPATVSGIKDIAAANLGITGSDQKMAAAKSQISVKEFSPKETCFFKGDLRAYQQFEVLNANLGEQRPKIKLTMLECPEPVERIAEIEFINIDTGQWVRYPGILRVGDTLILDDKSVLLNSAVPSKALVGRVPQAGQGVSKWKFKIKYITPAGSIIQIASIEETEGAFNLSALWFEKQTFRVEFLSEELTPAVFTVTAPWHIPGITDKFAETQDHPRHRILSLINIVKAAGVTAMISYYQDFAEKHSAADSLSKLTIKGNCLKEQHKIQEFVKFSGKMLKKEDHKIKDNAKVFGCFDYTQFGSLNFFTGPKIFTQTHDIKDKLLDIQHNQRHEIKDSFNLLGKKTVRYDHYIKDNLKVFGCFDYTKFGSLNLFKGTGQFGHTTFGSLNGFV